MRGRFRTFLNRDLWRAMFAGPLRVKVIVERLDGTELYHFYPLGSDTVEAGQTVNLEFEIGITLVDV